MINGDDSSYKLILKSSTGLSNDRHEKFEEEVKRIDQDMSFDDIFFYDDPDELDESIVKTLSEKNGVLSDSEESSDEETKQVELDDLQDSLDIKDDLDISLDDAFVTISNPNKNRSESVNLTNKEKKYNGPRSNSTNSIKILDKKSTPSSRDSFSPFDEEHSSMSSFYESKIRSRDGSILSDITFDVILGNDDDDLEEKLSKALSR